MCRILTDLRMYGARGGEEGYGGGNKGLIVGSSIPHDTDMITGEDSTANEDVLWIRADV